MHHILRHTLATCSVFLLICLVFLLKATTVVAQNAKPDPLPIEDIIVFSKVFETIKNSYVEPIKDEDLLQRAIEGMILGLDPHSAYLDSRGMTEARVRTRGSYGGVGMEVTRDGNMVRVVSPFDNSPADRAGIEAGDLIIRIDGRLIDRLNLDEVVDMLRGEPGTKVRVTVLRKGRDRPLNFNVERSTVVLKSVRSYELEPNFGYVRISQFQSNTAGFLSSAIVNLKKKADDNSLRGLILDLRNNPGGELKSAIEVSDAFIDSGVIVSTKNRNGEVEQLAQATPGDLVSGTPIVVLVNHGSASASEIVAGALQDHKRAVVMGTRTFGKGSVQSIIQVDNDVAIKLTTHRYYTPNDRSIQSSGVTPDIVVEAQQLVANDEESEGIVYRESDLTNSLQPVSTTVEGSAEDSFHAALVNDFQLRQALNLLKGLSIAGTSSAG